jgi:hypothetical protein
MQAHHGYKWGTFAPQLQLRLLQPKPAATEPRRQTPFDAEECKMFKAKGSCTFGSRCKYKHVRSTQSAAADISAPHITAQAAAPKNGYHRGLQYRAWYDELPHDYIDRDFILSGVLKGFHIVDFKHITDFVKLANHASALHNRGLVEDAIKQEIAHGRYIIAQQLPNIISPLGAIKKANGTIRLIHDCSRPSGRTLNDYAVSFSVHYQTIDHVKEFISKNMYMVKVDLVNAYRSVRLCAEDYCATGLSWRFAGDRADTILVDVCLPFGASASSGIFTCLTRAVTVMMRCRGFPNTVAYLDDFLLAEPTYERCLLGLYTLIRLLRSLGFDISYGKLQGPT